MDLIFVNEKIRKVILKSDGVEISDSAVVVRFINDNCVALQCFDTGFVFTICDAENVIMKLESGSV